MMLALVRRNVPYDLKPRKVSSSLFMWHTFSSSPSLLMCTHCTSLGFEVRPSWSTQGCGLFTQEHTSHSRRQHELSTWREESQISCSLGSIHDNCIFLEILVQCCSDTSINTTNVQAHTCVASRPGLWGLILI